MASIACRASDLLGECPLWDHRSDRILWIDILRGLVHSWSSRQGLRDVLRMDALIGSIALAGEADLLLATSQGLIKWIGSSGEFQVLANPIAGRPIRFNEGRVDIAGRWWIGTTALDPRRYAEPLGELYRFDPDGGIHRLEAGLTISNGLDWSPDGRVFYLTDTMRRAIYAYDFDARSGSITNRRIFVSTAETDGLPDGLVVDRMGDIWSACFAGSCIIRYSPAGQAVEKVELSVSCPTAVAFGGPELSMAFITTSQHVLTSGHGETDAGSLLTADFRSAGRPEAVFGKSAGWYL